jgi:hypothetical protein
MNAKQTTPIAAALAPLAVVAPELVVIAAAGCAVYFGLKWLLSDDKDKMPETASNPSVSERPAIRPLISTGNTVQNRDIPPISAGKPSVTLAPFVSVSVVPVNSAPAMPKNSTPVPKIPIPPPPAVPAVKIQPEIPLPPQKKFITREDMAKIFNGRHGMTRKSAVAALKALGFGKTAAYQALEINGRFSAWLQFASDGIITWTE